MGSLALPGRTVLPRRRALPGSLLAASALTLACAASLLTDAPAGADVFGPISLVSQSAVPGSTHNQQADYAHDPAISGNGQYVAFDGSYGGATGVWRRDLATGTVEQVAGGDAELPSISEDGRYISFTTTQALTPEDPNKGPDVYVRDMEPQPGEPEYMLVSAVNGSTEGLTYEYTGSSPMFEEEHYGSLASGRSALSANGQEVAFVTSAVSNLAGPHTPALQVAVRNLDTLETRLVSVRIGTSDEPVSTQEGEDDYGAVFTGLAGKAPAFNPPPSYGEYGATPPLGASLSADGSTVAWMGDDVGQQVALLPAETRTPSYTEPLWRRIAPGSETPTRPITGGSDPANPACAASGETVLPGAASSADPCQGPFATPEGEQPGIWAGGGFGELQPRLSADGYTVAFTAQAPPVSLGNDFGLSPFGRPSDLYVANMHEGLTRDQALTPLTELASGAEQDVATDGPIVDFDISPDGSQVAFTTQRTQFPLGSPAYVSAPAAEAGMSELFDVDLADGTLTRVTQDYEGGPSEHPHIAVATGRDIYTSGDGALSPSFSDDGTELAFSSTASNLVYGDGNTPPAGSSEGPFDGSDAFVVSRILFPATPTSQYVSGAPETMPTPVWNLGVTALSRANGSVLLYVQAPGAGTLRAGAQSAVVIQSPGAGRAGHRARHVSAARHAAVVRGAPIRNAVAVPALQRGHVATRTVATRATDAKGAGLETLTLSLSPVYRALAGERGGLSATVTVTFAAPGHATLRERIPVTFLRHKSRPSRAKARSRRAGKGSAKKAARRS
jgi:Tol biopolymer transport system component